MNPNTEKVNRAALEDLLITTSKDLQNREEELVRIAVRELFGEFVNKFSHFT